MKKLEQLLNNIKYKEFIYLLLTIPIALFIVYYNFILPKEEQIKTKTKQQIEKTLKNISNTVMQIRKIKQKQAIIRPTKRKLQNKQETYKFLKYSFYDVEIIKLNKERIYKILALLLSKSKHLNLNKMKFKIEWNKPKSSVFTQNILIKIEGIGDYSNIIKYLQYIEHLRVLLHINQTSINVFKKNEKFEIFLSIVGVK
jgi:hypothetical protein